jgi:Tol biopolymer transport system component
VHRAANAKRRADPVGERAEAGDDAADGVDLAAGTTRLVSTDASGTASGEGSSSDGLLSPDESTVVYETDSTGGWPSDPDEMDLYAKDLVTGSLTLVTPRTADTAGGTGELSPVGFTADGRTVVFRSDADNFGPVDENGTIDIYAHDLVSGTTHWCRPGLTAHEQPTAGRPTRA